MNFPAKNSTAPAAFDIDNYGPSITGFPTHHCHFPLSCFGAWCGTYITFCCIVSMTLIFGVHGSEIYERGPHASILISKPNPLFVESVKVERLDLSENEVMLYGFDIAPPLDVVTSWSENHKATLRGDSHKVRC